MAGGPRTRLTEPTDPGVLRVVRLENRTTGQKFYTVVVEIEPEVLGSYRGRAEWGRIGGRAIQEQVKATGSLATCEHALEALVRDKRGRGYQVVLDRRSSEAAASAPAPVAQPAAPASAEESLADVLERRRREAAWAF